MFKTIPIIVMATLCLNFSTKAQTEPSTSFSLPGANTIRIGDTIPRSFYQIKHKAIDARSPESYPLSLEAYQNKLIILDFWATWCAPCVHSIKKIDSLQKAMKCDDFVVIPVTYQNGQTAYNFLKKQHMEMPSIILDTTLKEYFPHAGIPHQIWIKNGKVIAIPQWKYANATNITRAVKGEPLQMMMNIQDGVIDPKKRLFVKGNGYTGKPLYAKGTYSVIARRLPGFLSHKITSLKNGDTTIVYGYNLVLTALFYGAYREEIAPSLGLTEGSGIYWEISDKLRNKLFNGPKPSKVADFEQDKLAETWRDANSYSYNLRYPKPINQREALKMMQKDLNTFFGSYLNLNAGIQEKRKPALILKVSRDKASAQKLLVTKGAPFSVDYGQKSGFYQLSNAPFKSLASWISRIHPNVLFTDSTGIGDLKIDIKLPADIGGDPKRIKEELEKYGLRLQQTEVMLPVLVIKEGRVK